MKINLGQRTGRLQHASLSSSTSQSTWGCGRRLHGAAFPNHLRGCRAPLAPQGQGSHRMPRSDLKPRHKIVGTGLLWPAAQGGLCKPRPTGKKAKPQLWGPTWVFGSAGKQLCFLLGAPGSSALPKAHVYPPGKLQRDGYWVTGGFRSAPTISVLEAFGTQIPVALLQTPRRNPSRGPRPTGPCSASRLPSTTCRGWPRPEHTETLGRTESPAGT